MLNTQLNKVLQIAMEVCIKNKSEYVTVEHLLFAILEIKESEKFFLNFDITKVELDNLKTELQEYIENPQNFSIIEDDKLFDPKVTPTMQKIMEKILTSISMHGSENIGIGYFIYFILEIENSFSYFLLNKYISLDEVKESFNKYNDNYNNSSEDIRIVLEKKYLEELASNSNKRSSLFSPNENQISNTKEKNYTLNLTKKAKENELEDLIGREKELKEIIRILSRKKKNNAMIVGESGVGKTTLIEGLALAFLDNELFKDYTILSLDVSKMISGTKYRGEFEERTTQLIEKLENEPKTILFIDEIHTIIQTSGTSNNYTELGNILKPYLTNGKLKILGATTFEDFYKIEKDKAYSRRFEKVELLEPTIEEAELILKGVKKHYENYHNVKYNDDIINLIVKLSKKYLLDKKLPDSALSILDDIGAKTKLNKQNINKIIDITEDNVKDVFYEVTKIPKSLLMIEDNSSLEFLEKNLKEKIFGQNEAVDTLLQKIITYRAGLGDGDRPAGTFLFTGPTGSGKTELTKEISTSLSMNLIRIDMSEFMEKHSISKLIGSPSGYVGYDEGGSFIKEIRKNPNSVILFDEVEKAHPEVLNILLQVMDYGKLKASDGTVAYFHNSIIIMTSNIGAVVDKTVGFNKKEGISNKQKQAIENHFSPEFLNRIDAIIKFEKLKEEDGVNIVNKFLDKIIIQLQEKNVDLELSLSAKELLVKKGFDEKFGARPLKKVIYDQVLQNIAKEILFGKLKNGGNVKIDVLNEELNFDMKEF